jgi:hypothetical protein
LLSFLFLSGNFFRMERYIKNPLIIVNTLLFTFLLLVIIQRSVDVTGAPRFVQNVFAAVAAITGEGSINQVAAFTATNAIGNSIIYDDGSRLAIGHTSPSQQVDATGFVKGRQGLCIGDDCRTRWPFGKDIALCVQTSVTPNATAKTCTMTGAVEDNMAVPAELFTTRDCKNNAQFNADFRGVPVHGFMVNFDPNTASGFGPVLESWTCYPGRSGCNSSVGYQC